MKKGFTLIELLVVVLIIGVLTAIALPQYEKAVEKAKVMRMLPLYRHVLQAIEEYDLATGQPHPQNFDELGPILPADWTGTDTNTATNGEWQLYLSTDNQHDWRFLGLTHLKGKYTGGGFMYLFRNSIQQGGCRLANTKPGCFPDHFTIVCKEAANMAAGKGGLCKKIFGGQYIGYNGDYLYTFPY